MGTDSKPGGRFGAASGQVGVAATLAGLAGLMAEDEDYEDDFEEEFEDEAGSVEAATNAPHAPAAAPLSASLPVTSAPCNPSSSNDFSTASLMAASEARSAPKGRGRSRMGGPVAEVGSGGGGGIVGGGSAPWLPISTNELTLQQPPVAHGAMGAIHAATWKGEPVAAKMLHDCSKNALRALELELLVHARLCHPNIVTLFGACISRCHLVHTKPLQQSVIRSRPAPSPPCVPHQIPHRQRPRARRRKPVAARVLRRDGESRKLFVRAGAQLEG